MITYVLLAWHDLLVKSDQLPLQFPVIHSSIRTFTGTRKQPKLIDGLVIKHMRSSDIPQSSSCLSHVQNDKGFFFFDHNPGNDGDFGSTWTHREWKKKPRVCVCVCAKHRGQDRGRKKKKKKKEKQKSLSPRCCPCHWKSAHACAHTHVTVSFVSFTSPSLPISVISWYVRVCVCVCLV